MSDQPHRAAASPGSPTSRVPGGRTVSPATPTASARLLFVHAHPDDESLWTGGTMARYAAEGAQVTLVTCTQGEHGEVLVPAAAHLVAEQEDRLGPYRADELAAAMLALGVADHRWLGGPGRYRDSGMAGTPAGENPQAFVRAPLDDPARDLATVIREVRPHVVATYDADGLYGHPDHVRAHEITARAVELAADPATPGLAGTAWDVPRLVAVVVPRGDLERDLRDLRDAADRHGFTVLDDISGYPYGVPDEVVEISVDVRPHLDAKRAALVAHATQVTVRGGFLALSNDIGMVLAPVEHYRVVRSAHGIAAPAPDDLLAGLVIDR